MKGHPHQSRSLGHGANETSRSGEGLTLRPNADGWVVVTHTILPNGAAHRLATALRGRGLKVAFCALPMPGAKRWRAEAVIEGTGFVTSIADLPHQVPRSRIVTNVASTVHFARRLRRLGIERPVLVGCDPVSYLQAVAAMRFAGIHPIAEIVWFVDWSAQRLESHLEGAAYRTAVRMAARRADAVCAISTAAARYIQEVAPTRRRLEPIRVLPNLPLAFTNGPPWELRAPQVVYMGGLRPEHGVDVLVAVARILLGGTKTSGVDVLGDGPLSGLVAQAADRLPGLRFHGVVERIDVLEQILHGARVGLALYDPAFPQFSSGDSLKTKDYLAAGLAVVTTSETGPRGGQVLVAPYDPKRVADTVQEALSGPAPALAAHPLLREGVAALDSLIAEVDRLTARGGA